MAQTAAMLARLNATSPQSAVLAQVLNVRALKEGGFDVEVRVGEQKIRIQASQRPQDASLPIYTSHNQLKVAPQMPGQTQASAPAAAAAAAASLNAASDIKGVQLNGLAKMPDPSTLRTLAGLIGAPTSGHTVPLLKAAVHDPSFAPWTRVLSQIEQAPQLKKWVESSLGKDHPLLKLAKQFEAAGNRNLSEPFVAQQESRAIQNVDTQARGLPTWTFDIPLRVAGQWSEGQAELGYHPREDSWRFELVFILPKSGRVKAQVTYSKKQIDIDVLADETGTVARMTPLVETLRTNLEAAGLTIGQCFCRPVTKAEQEELNVPNGRLDIRI